MNPATFKLFLLLPRLACIPFRESGDVGAPCPANDAGSVTLNVWICLHGVHVPTYTNEFQVTTDSHDVVVVRRQADSASGHRKGRFEWQ